MVLFEPNHAAMMVAEEAVVDAIPERSVARRAIRQRCSMSWIIPAGPGRALRLDGFVSTPAQSSAAMGDGVDSSIRSVLSKNHRATGTVIAKVAASRHVIIGTQTNAWIHPIPVGIIATTATRGMNVR